MADKWNENIPAVGNQIANDIPDIKENLEFIKDIFESQCKQTWDDDDATTIFPTTMKDADSDTMIQLEESADEDIIRFDVGETGQLMKITETKALCVDNINELTAANGVAIDGLTIKDGNIVTNASVDVSAIDDYCLIAFQSPTALNFTATGSLADILYGAFVMPAGATAMKMYARFKSSGAGTTSYMDFEINLMSNGTSQLNSSNLSVTGTSYSWEETSELDISGLVAGTEYEIVIRGYSSAGTGTVQGLTIYVY